MPASPRKTITALSPSRTEARSLAISTSSSSRPTRWADNRAVSESVRTGLGASDRLTEALCRAMSHGATQVELRFPPNYPSTAAPDDAPTFGSSMLRVLECRSRGRSLVPVNSSRTTWLQGLRAAFLLASRELTPGRAIGPWASVELRAQLTRSIRIQFSAMKIPRARLCRVTPTHSSPKEPVSRGPGRLRHREDRSIVPNPDGVSDQIVSAYQTEPP